MTAQRYRRADGSLAVMFGGGGYVTAPPPEAGRPDRRPIHDLAIEELAAELEHALEHVNCVGCRSGRWVCLELGRPGECFRRPYAKVKS